MKHTPLHAAHRSAGGKLVDFAGWEIPLQYRGVLEEYRTVRNAAGLFDVSHMGRLAITGPDSLPYLQRVTTNDVAKLAPLESHYTMVLNPQGGIKDDVFLSRLGADRFLLCVNASNREKIFHWLLEQRDAAHVTIEDQSRDLAQLAIQGPSSRDILAGIGVRGIQQLGPRRLLEATVDGAACLISRTGYTGELGYELYVPADHAPGIWERLLRHGEEAGLKPAGLGARDLLRLDMGYLLYGNDISEEITPLEANVAWTVSFAKGEFIGRAVLLKKKARELPRCLIGFELL